MTEVKRTSFFAPFSEALLIAILTGAAYWLTFLYEAGYLSVFDIPAQLAEVRLETVLVVGLSLGVFLFLLFLVVNFLSIHWPSHPAIQEKVYRIGILLLVPFWYLINYGLRKDIWIAYVFGPAWIVIFELLWPILVHRDKESIRDRFIASEIAESEVRSRGIFGRIFLSFGPFAYELIYHLFLVFTLGGALAYTAGMGKAITQKGYLLLSDQPSVAVIRIYPDLIIGMPFNRQTKTLQSALIIRKIGTENIALTLDRNVGPLKIGKGETEKEQSEPKEMSNNETQIPSKNGK